MILLIYYLCDRSEKKGDHKGMKVYLFYHLIDGLEPALTAFSGNKEKAKLYKKIRKGFYYKEVESTEDEYNKMVINHNDLMIELQTFRTSSGFHKFSVILPATVHEINEIILHKDDLVLSELQKYVLPTDLFTKSVQSALYEIGFMEAHRFIAPTGYIDDYIENDHLKNFEVDELGLFLCLHKDTINENAIKNVDKK